LSPQSLWKGNGIYISPDDEYITVSDLSAISGSQNRTICIVGKTTKTGNISYLFSCGSPVTGQKYAMRLDDLNSDTLRVEIDGGYVSGGVAGNDGDLHTFVSVLNGTLLSDVTLYVDGLLQGITASANTGTTINTVLGGYPNNIGNENNSDHASWGDNIESVIVFDTNLIAAQVKFLSDNPYFMYQIPEELYGYVAGAPPPASIINQFMKSNLGSNLYNGVFQ